MIDKLIKGRSYICVRAIVRGRLVIKKGTIYTALDEQCLENPVTFSKEFKVNGSDDYRTYFELLPETPYKRATAISFDLHGVLTDAPKVMKAIMEPFLKVEGNEIHILTGSTTEKAIDELRVLGFTKGEHYTHVKGLPDILEEAGYESTGINRQHGNKEYKDEHWYLMKAIYCGTRSIDLHFDDEDKHGEQFYTPFARVFTKDR